MLDHLQRHDDRPLASAPELGTAEVIRMIEREQALHLTDILQRRTDLAFTGRVSDELLDELASLMGEHLRWSDAEKASEITTTRHLLSRRHHIRL